MCLQGRGVYLSNLLDEIQKLKFDRFVYLSMQHNTSTEEEKAEAEDQEKDSKIEREKYENASPSLSVFHAN